MDSGMTSKTDWLVHAAAESRVGNDVTPPVSQLQIKNILCPVDFSGFAQRALLYSIGLARHFGSRLFVQHTVQPAYAYFGGPEPNALEIDIAVQLKRAREEIRKMLSDARIDSSEVTLLLNDGDVATRISETISKERIDLLVMGTHGHHGFNRLVLGSLTDGMIHASVCPVLVVSKPQDDFYDPEQGELFRTILLATDFSAHSDRALAVALKWACEWSAKLVLFHAVQQTPSAMKGLVDLFPEYNPYFEKQVARAWEQIQSLVPEAARERCKAVYEVRHGQPKEEILRVAEEKAADLIVTGARGTGKPESPWGSVSSTVVRNGRWPVLVVRALAASRSQS
jgi:nucleotide-binding universal stress UspA family protein